MIGPPGLPKSGRRVFSFTKSFATSRAMPHRRRRHLWKWILGLYLAGVAAHMSHHLALDLPKGLVPSFREALASAPVSFAWPADLIGTLIELA
jgi:hypothetical protein